MGRPKNFDETKALQAAMRLFWQKGYPATSLKELEIVMGLNPTSIYNAFGSKSGLFEKALKLYLDTVLIKFLTPLNTAKPIAEVINSMLMEVINLHYNKPNPGGCMVVLSLLESDQLDEGAKIMLDSALFLLRDAIIKRLEQGQESGEINLRLKCSVTANHMVALIPGVITMAKSGFSRKELEELMVSSSTLLLRNID